MRDLEKLFRETGLAVKGGRFLSPPRPPFLVLYEGSRYRGSDFCLSLAERSARLELYAERRDPDSERKVEDILEREAFEYSKERIWLPDAKWFETIYEFEFLEKR